MPVAYAKPWDITEEMLQEMVQVMPVFEERMAGQMGCPSQSKGTRIENQKGFNFEVTFLDDTCTNDLFFSREAIIDKFKLLLQWREMASWFQRGFFFNYIYKDKNNKILAEMKVDREALFGKPISIFHEEESGPQFIIDVGDQRISLNSFGLPITDLIVPGKPVSEKYCDIEFKQERSFFVSDNVSLVFSVIQLSENWPVEDQLRCMNVGDFDLIFSGKNFKDFRVLKAPADKFVSDDMNLVFKVVDKTKANNEVIWVAFSRLLGNRKAVYFGFGGPANESTEQLIKSIMDSVRINNIDDKAN